MFATIFSGIEKPEINWGVSNSGCSHTRSDGMAPPPTKDQGIIIIGLITNKQLKNKINNHIDKHTYFNYKGGKGGTSCMHCCMHKQVTAWNKK